MGWDETKWWKLFLSYFGESRPTNQTSFEYLTIDNVLEDYGNIIEYFTQELNISHVITVGGSYGGFLSGMLRAK